MLIGAGELKDGLYYFQNKSCVKAHNVTRIGSLELWHARLGNPSLKVTKFVPTVDARKGSTILNKPCDICHQAKHTRDSFSIRIVKLLICLS